MSEASAGTSERSWSRKKRDPLPRGLFVHPASTAKSTLYAIRYMCGAGHVHQEKAGPLKSDAIRRYHDRRGRMRDEPGWCPRVKQRQARDRMAAEREREARRVTFGKYAEDYLEWAKIHKRSWAKDESRLNSAILPAFRDRPLDAITTAEVERLLRGLIDGRAPATVNRFRDQLSGMFKRAVRLGLVATNPVTGIPKLREASGRIVYLTADDETALHEALPRVLRPMMTFAVNTGLRWSEQAGLEWGSVDMLTGLLTVRLSKNGQTRQVPMNAVVRSVLFDLAAGRERPNDPTEAVFPCAVPHGCALVRKGR
jgi:integrase